MRVKTLRGLFSVIFDERQESLLEAVLVAETAGLGEFFGAAVAGTVTAEHQIFGRVGEVDELDDVDVVAFVLQDRCADGVSQQRREALLKQPVGEQNVEIAALWMVLLTSCWQQGTEKMCSTPREMA